MAQIILDSNNNLIQGDFDNATLNNRTKLQTTTTNATTNVYVVPNGSSTSAGVSVANNSSLTNASKIVMATNGSTDTQIISGVNGSGSYLPLSFYTNNALAMQINTSGNVGIGVTPSAWGVGLSQKALQISTAGALMGLSAGTGNQQTNVITNAYFDGADWKYITSDAALLYSQNTGGIHQWLNAPSGTAGNTVTFVDRMRIDANGNVLVGTTNSSQTAGVGIKFNYDAAGNNVNCVTSATTNGGSSTYVYYSTGAAAYRFYVGAGGTVFATSTTISGISDVRLKENIRDLDDGLDTVLALKPRKFDWKEGKGKDIKNDRGFIAQEFEQILPDLIDEWKDTPPEGEEPYKSVRPDLIPVLVKAIQEQQTIINELKTRIEALESK